MDELINQISAELSKNDTDSLWISMVDLDYAYGQMKLSSETSKHCKFAIEGEIINGYYRFRKGLFRPGRHNFSRENRLYTWTRNTRMARRHHNHNTRIIRTTHPKTRISLGKIRKRRLHGQQKEIKFLSKRNSLVWTHDLTRRHHNTIHMPQKWNLSSSEKCTFRKTRANRILVKQCIEFVADCDAQCNPKMQIVIIERN